jgi:predicted DCC family thiol-disulfide oxidoreductase YuxK
MGPELKSNTDPATHAAVALAAAPVGESGQLNSRWDLRFPHPIEQPRSIVVVFDGRCRFCTQQVRWLHRLDFARRISFISLHDPWVARWWPPLTYDLLMQQIYVIPPHPDRPDDLPARQTWYPGARGARYLAWRLPLLWPVALLLSLPGTLPLWQMIYRWIARQRYRFGTLGPACDPDGTCDLHFGPSGKSQA